MAVVIFEGIKKDLDASGGMNQTQLSLFLEIRHQSGWVPPARQTA
jgi:hypothetical protein